MPFPKRQVTRAYKTFRSLRRGKKAYRSRRPTRGVKRRRPTIGRRGKRVRTSGSFSGSRGKVKGASGHGGFSSGMTVLSKRANKQSFTNKIICAASAPNIIVSNGAKSLSGGNTAQAVFQIGPFLAGKPNLSGNINGTAFYTMMNAISTAVGGNDSWRWVMNKAKLELTLMNVSNAHLKLRIYDIVSKITSIATDVWQDNPLDAWVQSLTDATSIGSKIVVTSSDQSPYNAGFLFNQAFRVAKFHRVNLDAGKQYNHEVLHNKRRMFSPAEWDLYQVNQNLPHLTHWVVVVVENPLVSVLGTPGTLSSVTANAGFGYSKLDYMWKHTADIRYVQDYTWTTNDISSSNTGDPVTSVSALNAGAIMDDEEGVGFVEQTV